MEDIRIYDFEFNLLHIEHRFIAANWCVKYNGIGTFEAHFPMSSEMVSIVMKQRYLIAVQGKKQAVITGMQTGDDFTIYGRTLNWLLTKRMVAKFKTEDLEQTDLAGIADYVLKEAFVENANYPVSNMVLECDVTCDIGSFWRNTCNSSYDVIHDLCVRADDAGHELIFDTANKRWKLHLYSGTELPLIISESNRNACDVILSRDILDLATDGWYERSMKDRGEWNAATNKPFLLLTEADPSSVYDYYRVSEDGVQNGVSYRSGDYILCGSDGFFTKVTEMESVWERVGESSLTGIYRWEEKLTGTTPAEAEVGLMEKNVRSDLDAEMRQLHYGTDYRLGDRVQVRYKNGNFTYTGRKRITELNINYETNNETVQPVFTGDEAEQEE